MKAGKKDIDTLCCFLILMTEKWLKCSSNTFCHSLKDCSLLNKPVIKEHPVGLVLVALLRSVSKLYARLLMNKRIVLRQMDVCYLELPFHPTDVADFHTHFENSKGIIMHAFVYNLKINNELLLH